MKDTPKRNGGENPGNDLTLVIKKPPKSPFRNLNFETHTQVLLSLQLSLNLNSQDLLEKSVLPNENLPVPLDGFNPFFIALFHSVKLLHSVGSGRSNQPGDPRWETQQRSHERVVACRKSLWMMDLSIALDLLYPIPVTNCKWLFVTKSIFLKLSFLRFAPGSVEVPRCSPLSHKNVHRGH